MSRFWYESARWAVLAAVMAILSVSCSSGRASAQAGAESDYRPRPLPCGKSALTAEKQETAFRAWLLERRLANYRAFGKRDPKWDAAVERFFRNGVRALAEPRNRDPWPSLAVDAQNLLGENCDDPLVVALCGVALWMVQKRDEAYPAVRDGYDALVASRYPEFERIQLARVFAMLLSGRKERAKSQKLWQMALIHLGQAAGDPDFRNGYQRHYFRIFQEECLLVISNPDEFPIPWERAAKVLMHLRGESDRDPWIEDVVEGWFHIHRAWAVTEDDKRPRDARKGWKGRTSDLERAQEFLMRAHEEHPQFPEAATLMINVRLGLDGPGCPRAWFDRAVAAQFDYRPAYMSLCHAYLPRWGGSHRQLVGFAAECLGTRRFDTHVPDMVTQIAKKLGTDLGALRQGWLYPGMPPILDAFLERAGRSNPRARLHDSYGSARAILAWLTGDREKARALHEALGPRFKPVWLKYLDVDPRDFPGGK